mmetsp:Transcript_19528/g.36522  ORF Transcript_19528/g.36522 Transcript_19528/m.36522 type:complete len:129 (-) Transcript_19528:1167-1553(-)
MMSSTFVNSIPARMELEIQGGSIRHDEETKRFCISSYAPNKRPEPMRIIRRKTSSIRFVIAVPPPAGARDASPRSPTETSRSTSLPSRRIVVVSAGTKERVRTEAIPRRVISQFVNPSKELDLSRMFE